MIVGTPEETERLFELIEAYAVQYAHVTRLSILSPWDLKAAMATERDRHLVRRNIYALFGKEDDD